MDAIAVSLDCKCGRSVIARSADAGSSINCPCGRSVPVPRLSHLRTMVGRDAFVTNPVEAIAKAQRAGQSPAGDKCLLCGAHSPAIYRCDATCESSHVKRSASAEPNDIPRLIAFMFLGWVAKLILSRSGSNEAVVHGHDVGVSFDLPVCDHCAATSGKPTRPTVAKEIMCRVPVYQELLQRYPELTLSVKRSAA